MDEDYAYRLSVLIFKKISQQSYDNVSELRLILEEAKGKCYPVGDMRRLLWHYEVSLDKLEAGVYYPEVVKELSDNIFLSPILSTTYNPLDTSVSSKGNNCCLLL